MVVGCHRSEQDAEADARCILRSSMDFEENYKSSEDILVNPFDTG
jgi:hypothetical protein